MSPEPDLNLTLRLTLFLASRVEPKETRGSDGERSRKNPACGWRWW